MTELVRRNYPIVIMAFNRPDYLKEVLDSLLQQQGACLDERRIALFQDGSYNEYSQKKYADPADIAANIAAFRERFPEGAIAHSPTNLGVALNFDRAERWAFETLAADAAIFLEDDMVLSPHYIRTVDRMLDMAMEDKRIGYVAAYGDWNRTLAKQHEHPGRLAPLPQNWAFGLTRHQWLKIQSFLEEYLPFVRGIDYRFRPHTRIYDLYSRYGMERVESSQDRAKLIACALTGGLRVNTTACLARYIGRVGLHSNERLYVASGFERTEIYPDGDFAIQPVTDEIYEQLMKRQLAHVTASSPWLDQNTPLAFTRGGNGLPGLRQSFYAPESWGVWSGIVDPVVSVKLPMPHESQVRRLWITANHYTASLDEDIAVEVKGNGHLLGNIMLGRKQRRVQLPLSLGVVGQNGILELSFHSPSISSPKDQGQSEDGRPLGVGLVKLELE